MLCCLKGHLSWVVQWKAVDWIRVHLTGFMFRSLQEGIRGLCHVFCGVQKALNLSTQRLACPHLESSGLSFIVSCAVFGVESFGFMSIA